MKAISFLLLLILLCPTLGLAAQIYGKLRENENPVGQGVRVEIACGAGTYSGQTDDQGTYSVFVRQTGRCRFTVYYKGQTPRTEIYSSDEPYKYDFDLVQQGGRYGLNRR